MDFKRIGISLIGVTILLGALSVLSSLFLHGAIAQHQEPGFIIALVLRVLAYISIAGLVICAIMTAITEQQVTKAVLPLVFSIVGLLFTIGGSGYAFSALVAAVLSSITVFFGEKSEPVWQRNIIMIFGLIAIVAFNVGLASLLTGFNAVSMVGLLLGVPAFLLALIYTVQHTQWEWVALLIFVGACGPLLLLITGHHHDVGLLFVPMTAIATVRGFVWNESVTNRHTFGTMALLGLVMIIGGGTLINSVFSTVPIELPVLDPLQYGRPEAITFYAGIDMYFAAGILGIIAWIFSVLYAARHSMWGWFTAALLLPGIGALMLGFFGPTPQDYQQGKSSAAAKRAAGA